MADKDNVISLEDRLRRGGKSKDSGAQPKEGAAGAAQPPEKPSGQPDARAGMADDDFGDPLPGKLIWLYCPGCETYQYTELAIPGGRKHNVCGATVEEVEVPIDVRAEWTLAVINLERLRAVEELLQAQRAHFEEYQQRLRLIAGKEPVPYPLTEESLKRLPVAVMDPVGLLIPEALHDPARRFAPQAETSSADSSKTDSSKTESSKTESSKTESSNKEPGTDKPPADS